MFEMTKKIKELKFIKDNYNVEMGRMTRRLTELETFKALCKKTHK